MKLKSLLVGAVAGLLLTACGGGTSPDSVTKTFVEALAAGDCDKALGMAVDAAAETVQSTADAGCAAYDTEIVSVECPEESEEAATCKCTEKRDGMEQKFNYTLKKVDGEWKIAEYQKDMDMDLDM